MLGYANPVSCCLDAMMQLIDWLIDVTRKHFVKETSGPLFPLSLHHQMFVVTLLNGGVSDSISCLVDVLTMTTRSETLTSALDASFKHYYHCSYSPKCTFKRRNGGNNGWKYYEGAGMERTVLKTKTALHTK